MDPLVATSIAQSLKLRNGESMGPLVCHLNCAMVNQWTHCFATSIAPRWINGPILVCHLRNGESMGPWGYGFDPSSSFDFYVLNAGNGRETFRMVLTTLAKSVPILSAVECKRVTNMSLSRQKRGDFDLKSTKNRRTRPDPTPPPYPPTDSVWINGESVGPLIQFN